MGLIRRLASHGTLLAVALGPAQWHGHVAAAASAAPSEPLVPAVVPSIVQAGRGQGAGAPAAGSGTACAPDAEAPRAERLAACPPLLSDPAGLAERLGRELGLASEPAGWLARGLAHDLALSDGSNTEALREIESDYVNALKLAPGATDLADQLRRFYLHRFAIQAPAVSLVEVIAGAPDPEALALRLARSDHGFGTLVDTQIFLAALASRPRSTVLWMKAARSIDAPAWRLAFLAEASRNAGASGGAATGMEETAAARVAAGRLAELFDDGLPQEMLSAFRSLPEPVRALFVRGAPPVRLPLDDTLGAAPDRAWRDLRWELAAAHLLAGDREGARRWAARAGRGESGATGAALAEAWPAAAATDEPDGSAAPEARRSEEEQDELLAARRRLIVERTLAPGPADPFPLLAAWVAEAGRRSVGWELTAARFARRESYPGIAAHLRASAAREGWVSWPPDTWEPSVAVMPRVRGEVERLRTAMAKLRSELAGEADAARAARRAALPADPAAATIARLLAAPPRTVFAELPMPPGLAAGLPAAGAPAPSPATATATEGGSGGTAAPKPLTLPAGFSAVRAERQGDRAAAIGVSQDYDPVGEVTAGAYWVALSRDGGKTWERPLYTGLRVDQPYEVVPRSALPLLAGDSLQVEVEVRELDPGAITFPPAALKPKRVAKGLYLEIPLAVLRRDSDGDGLTDLAEERLLTDPDDPDTDHDGVPDGSDLLPHVVQSADSSPRARALTALLDGIGGWAAQVAIVEGVKEWPRECYGPVSRASISSEQTLFVVGDRALFAGVRPGRRLVVLTPEEEAAAKKKFGPFYPLEIELFEVDRAGRRAVAVWSSSWTGGHVRLEEQDGTFRVVDEGGWLT